MELACDEAAIGTAPAAERADYCESILRFATVRQMPGALAFGQGQVAKRVAHLLKYRKPAPLLLALGCVLVALGCGVCALRPQAETTAPQAEPVSAASEPTPEPAPSPAPDKETDQAAHQKPDDKTNGQQADNGKTKLSHTGASVLVALTCTAMLASGGGLIATFRRKRS